MVRGSKANGRRTKQRSFCFCFFFFLFICVGKNKCTLKVYVFLFLNRCIIINFFVWMNVLFDDQVVIINQA